MRSANSNAPALWSLVVFFLIMAASEGNHGSWSKVAMSWLLIGTWGTYIVVKMAIDLMDDEEDYYD